MQRRSRAITVAGAVAALALGTAAPGTGAATKPVASWEMNQPSGARTMVDSGPHDIDGNIGSAVVTGVVYAGATGYRWPSVNPVEPPAKPERLVTVNDGRLNPGSGDYAITMRFRTTRSAGNMIQKGQSGTAGGYYKWQNVRGKITCLFRGRTANGTVVSKSVNSGDTPLNDGAWHVLTCERTADLLTLTIDGSRTRRAHGPTGTISNTAPVTLGGKLNCDQVKVTCDYFSGDMDYVRITSD